MDNKMTFFSGTDISTLKEEGVDRNHFVSLIVNNAGTYTAAITRRVKSIRTVHEVFSYNSFNDTFVEATDDWVTEEIDELQYFNLDIEKEGANYSFPDVDERLTEIKKSKEAKAKTIPSYTPSGNYGKGWTASAKTQEQGNATLNAVQPALPFETKEMAHFDENGVVSEHNLKADPHLIHSLCLQLLTGSVMIPNESKIDIKKWVNNLRIVVERRFGAGIKGIKLYSDYIENMVEFLVWNTEDPNLANIVDSDLMMSIIASDMMDYLGTLPSNEYNKICQSALASYIS